jgi:flagellar hook-associated protein FlgK
MSDLIGVGVSGLSAYQRALATTSNNIANLQTEGYVRQRAVLAASTQDGSARISIGTGVRFAEVQRLYDQFAEANLQRATSGLEAEKSLLTELQSLQNALGSSDAGLHGAFQDFFDSARELEASPASAGTRAGFLAKAEGLAARFRALASTAASLDDGTRAQMEQAAGETNRFLEQIASLNSQLLKRSSASEQPMQLLDQRDNAIREISERLGITVVIGPSGAANIYAGDSASGAALVENGRARSVSVQFDPYDYGKVDFVLDAQSQPVPLPVVRSGSMGGLFSFRREGLGTTVNKLDELALAFGRTVNKIHQQGIDSAGRPGEALFYVGPNFVVDGAANGGSARLGVSVADADLVKSASYELKYSAALSKWEARNSSTGSSTTGGTEFTFEGLRFSVQGAARDGDTFRVTPDNHPSATIVTLIKDGAQVASAGKLAVRADIGNVSATAAEVRLEAPRTSTSIRSIEELLPSPKEPVVEQSFTQDPKIKIDPYQDTVVAARTGPIAVIPAGYSKLALSTAIDEDSALAVFTRDGRQLSGPKMAATIVDEKYGFYAGATYSDTYLNQSAPSSTVSGAWTTAQRSAVAGNSEKYLIELRKGDQIVALNLTPAVGATLTAANVDAALAVEAEKTGTGTLAAAGMAFRGKAIDGTLAFYSKDSSPPFSIAVTNTLSAQRGGFAGSDFSSTTPVTVPVISYLGLSYSRGVYAESSRQVDVDGRPILTPARLLGVKEVTVATADYTLLLNCQEIGVNQGDSVEDIRDAINAQTSAVGVTSRKADDGSLILAAHNDVSFDVAEIDTVNEDRASLMINGTEYSAGWRVRISESQLAEKDNFITLNGEKYSFTSLADLGAQLNAKRVSGQAVFGASVAAGKLTLTVKDAGLALQSNNFLKIGANSLGFTEREEYFFETPSSNAVATKLASFINTTKSSVTATKDGDTFTISNTPINAGNAISIGLNTVGLATQTYFNANAISLDVKPTDINGNSVSRTVLGDLGFRSGFVMREPLAEDLLIFGVDQQGESTTISLSGNYQAGDPPTDLMPDARAYTLEFAGGQYSIIDQETGTVVAAQKLDTTSRTVRYGNWAVTLQAIPSDGDEFTILPNDDAKGDNRVIALIANLQFDRGMLPSGQTAQQEYEDLVNRVGVLTVQTEVGRDAQKVVFDLARESRDRVSGVNLDEELADLLRYQQAYQANAQVIQTASRLFDTLMQRL